MANEVSRASPGRALPPPRVHAVGVISHEGSFGELHPHRTGINLDFRRPRVNRVSASTIRVDAEDNRLETGPLVQARFPALGHGHLEKLLRTGQVRVDGKRAKAGDRLKPAKASAFRRNSERCRAQCRRYHNKRRINDTDQQVHQSLVLHEDPTVIVLNKPSGLATQGGSGITRHVDGLLAGLQGNKRQTTASCPSPRSRYVRRFNCRAHAARGGGTIEILAPTRCAENLLGADQGRSQAASRRHQAGACERIRFRQGGQRRTHGHGRTIKKKVRNRPPRITR